MRKNGYTFVELMVVIAIITILALISFPYYQRTKGQFVIERASVSLSQDLRRAQEMAMSATEFNGSIPNGGYGIYIDVSEPGHYILFADLDEDEICDEPGEVVEDIDLEGSTSVTGIGDEAYICPGGICTDLVVIFKPPDPEVVIRGRIFGFAWFSLSGGGIELDFNGLKKGVFLNKTGLIYVE